MNANELINELYALYGDDGSLPCLIGDAETMLRQQQAEIKKVNAEWVQAAMALGRAVQEIHEQKVEIDALKILRKAQEK